MKLVWQAVAIWACMFAVVWVMKDVVSSAEKPKAPLSPPHTACVMAYEDTCLHWYVVPMAKPQVEP